MCICALFVGGKCECGASGTATVMLEVEGSFGAVENCVSGGSGWRAGDL